MDMKMKMADQPVLSLNDVREVLEQHRKQKAKSSLRDAAGRALARSELEDQFKHKLENAIREGGKYRVLKKMARLFDEKTNVKNYKLVQCFIPTIRGLNGRRRKFSEHDYKDRKSFYDDDEKINNHFKGLKKYWETLGYTVKFGKYSSRVALTKTLGKK